jgi:Region found in RelA / SpoT proteins
MPMKISRSVIERFKEQEENALELRRVLGFRISEWCKSNNWIYVDRIKKDESYAQKIEQSRSDKIDDVYAGTIIVKNRLDVKNCCELLEKDKTLGIALKRKLPKDFEKSSFSAETFTFDSVRMYFKTSKPDINSPYYHLNKVFEREIFNEVFEIQIKTLLDEAWGKASHDFSYKTDGNLSWAKSRLMFQIKALLENAEMALSHPEILSEVEILQKSDDRLDKLNNIMQFYRENWGKELLPNDMKRLAENTRDLLDYLSQNLDWLKNIIQLETAAGRGSNIMNLSPYWIVVQSIIETMGWMEFLKRIDKSLNNKKNTFPIIQELERPENINLNNFPNIREI